MTTLLLLLALACTEKAPPDPSTEAPVPGSDGTEAARTGLEDGEPPAGTARTPAEMYAECRDRVEGPEQAGECTTDADCAQAGCGQEVCTTGKMAAEVMTTCEMRLCFEVLDTCGCREGTCSWALKAEAPPPRPRLTTPDDVPQ